MTTAGFAHVDITPPLGSPLAGYGSRDQAARAVLDRLFARAMVLESAGTRVAVVGTDLLGIEADLVAAARAKAERASGVPQDAILICASHTHFGPALGRTGYLPEDLEQAISADYAEELTAKLAQAVALADAARRPARVGVGQGWAPGISFNRRPLDSSGRCQMAFVAPEATARWAAAEGARQALAALGLSGVEAGSSPPPDDSSASLRWGPTDPQVPVLRVEGQDGPLGGLVSFACHPVCGDREDVFNDLSADYPGELQAALRAMIGCEVVFALGCAGQQVPLVRGPGSRRHMGTHLGEAVAAAWATGELRDPVALAAARRPVELPLKDFAAMAAPADGDPESRYLRHLQARYAGQATVATEVQALRIGDLGLVSLPGEIFVEIGHAIKRQSPFPVTAPISMGNDYLGYVATLEAYPEGGYEPGSNAVAPEAAGVLVKAAVEALRAVAR